MMRMYESDEILQTEDQNSLEHHGIKGQKWGQRRFQNPDGSYTELGKERRRVGFKEESKKEDDKSENKAEQLPDIKIGGKAYKDMTKKELRAARKRARHNEAERRAQREFNRDKREAIEKGDISFISKNISRFTNQEIDDAVNRYKKMQNVWAMDKANKKDADYYLDKTIHYLNKAGQVTKGITDIANYFNNASKNAAEKRKTGYLADQEYYKSLQEEYKALHPDSGNKNDGGGKKDKNNNKDNKDSGTQKGVENEKKKLQEMKKKDPDEMRIDDLLKKQAEEDAREKAQEKHQKKLDKMARKEAKREAKERERDERAAERERERQEEEEYERQERKEREAREEKERQEQYEKEKAERAAERKRLQDEYDKMKAEQEENERKRQEAAAQRKAHQEAEQTMQDYWWDLMYSGKKKESLLGSFFSKKDKDKYKDYKNSDQYKKLEEDLKEINSKYLSNLQDAYSNQKVGSASGSRRANKYNKYPSNNVSPKHIHSVQDEKWSKQMKSGESHKKINDWIKDMTKKYQVERGMSKAKAKEYAERYVDAWLEAYDEGKV